MEIGGGSWEGKPWADFPVIDPQQSYYWDYEPYRFAPAGGETMRQVHERVQRAILEIVAENEGKTVCVTSHGCAIRNILCWTLGLPFEKLNEVDWGDNTAINVIDFDSSHHPTVLVQNDASHPVSYTHLRAIHCPADWEKTNSKESYWHRYIH